MYISQFRVDCIASRVSLDSKRRGPVEEIFPIEAIYTQGLRLGLTAFLHTIYSACAAAITFYYVYRCNNKLLNRFGKQSRSFLATSWPDISRLHSLKVRLMSLTFGTRYQFQHHPNRLLLPSLEKHVVFMERKRLGTSLAC